MPDRRPGWLCANLCKLSGEDTGIIFSPETDTAVAAIFAVIGLLVFVIFSLSVYSSVHFFTRLLAGYGIIVIPIGLFWGSLIAVIYYLLLFTITPPILRGRDHAIHGLPREETTEKKVLSRISLLFRVLFVSLLAIIIAQPCLVSLFDGTDLLDSKEFFIHKIQLIDSRFPLSRLVTFSMVALFIIPIGLKYLIRDKYNFYTVKKLLEERIVTDEYAAFKKKHADIFATRFGIVTEWYESCIDPPFNRRKKDFQQEQIDQQLLLAEIYRDKEDSEANKYHVSETIT